MAAKKSCSGSCRCGFVRFTVAADIDHVRVCDCSVCRKRGALNFRVAGEDMRIETALDRLSVYRWGSCTAAEYFCPTCGILPRRRPSHSTAAKAARGAARFDGWAINVRCLDGVDAEALSRHLICGSGI